MNPLLFGAGRITVHDSYFYRNDPHQVARDIEPYRQKVPDDCDITLYRGVTLAGMFRDQTRAKGARDLLLISNEECGAWLKARAKGQSTGDLIKAGIAWVTRTRKEREAIRHDPVALAERLWIPGEAPTVRQEPVARKPWWRFW